MVCAVVECKNGAKQKKLRGSELAFHRFPKSPHIRKMWVSKCKRLEVFDLEHSKVCSDHFVPEDYQRDLKNELLQLPTVKRLKPSAVPSVFPGRIIDEKTKKREAIAFKRKKRVEKREHSRIIREILKEHEKNGNEEMESITDIEEAEQEDVKPLILIQEINPNQVDVCFQNNEQDLDNAEQATPECSEISEDQVKMEADGYELNYELAASSEKPRVVVDVDECSNCEVLKKRIIELELRKKLSDHMVCYQMKELERLNTMLLKAREKIKNLEAKVAR